jgi:hypothetical protein
MEKDQSYLMHSFHFLKKTKDQKGEMTAYRHKASE